MELVKKIWNFFLTRSHVWFFYGFFITFTLSIRKVLFFHPILENFNEYAGIYLYLSDIFLFFTILPWLISILRNKSIYLSSLKPYKEISFLALALVTWSLISISWSTDKNLALFRFIKLAEFGLLFVYVIYNVPRGTILKRIFQIIIFLGLFQAIIGIGQFVLQHSIGIFWLKESLISPDIPGVAKIILDGHKLIRAYGLFPHPNILGGFLLISVILTWQYRKLFHGEQFRNQATKTWGFLIPQFLALFLTFSKSAWIGLVIVTVYVAWKNVPYGTFYNLRKRFCMGQVTKIALLLLIILASAVIIFKPDTNSLLFKSFSERLFYVNVSRETIANNPMIGVGMGQFVPSMQKYSQIFISGWQYQPVHNVFLLIWSELGVVDLILFILILWKMFRVKQSSGNVIFKGILLGFIFIALFDHYLWDIQQGQIMLWLVLGLTVQQD